MAALLGEGEGAADGMALALFVCVMLARLCAREPFVAAAEAIGEGAAAAAAGIVAAKAVAAAASD
jgi:hypothetical protein